MHSGAARGTSEHGYMGVFIDYCSGIVVLSVLSRGFMEDRSSRGTDTRFSFFQLLRRRKFLNALYRISMFTHFSYISFRLF